MSGSDPRFTISGTDIVANRFLILIHTQENENGISRRPEPSHHTQKMKARLQETVTHLREDIQKVDEPQLKAMFETSAEVLSGLVRAFGDYEKKNEAAWRKPA